MATDIKATCTKTTEWLLFIICIVITAASTLIYSELHRHNMIAQSRFSYSLNKDFNSNYTDSAIGVDIEAKHKLFKENGGKWAKRDIDEYLGFFELMEDYIEAGSLNTRDVYDNYSDEILAAYNHPEIKQYIANLRATTKDNGFYEKFEKLAKEFAAANEIKK